MRLAGTARQYSGRAISQELAITIHSASQPLEIFMLL
jgi:hypothetical protein